VRLFNALEKIEIGKTVVIEQDLDHYAQRGYYEMVCFLESESMAILKCKDDEAPDLLFGENGKEIILKFDDYDIPVSSRKYSMEKNFLIIKFDKAVMTLKNTIPAPVITAKVKNFTEKRVHTRFEFEEISPNSKTRVIHLKKKEEVKGFIKNVSRGGCLLIFKYEDGKIFKKENPAVFRYIAGIEIEDLTAEVIFTNVIKDEPDYIQVAFRFDKLVKMPRILEITRRCKDF
jgi:hypothetical protein